MKKILIRAGMSPLEPFDAAKMIMDNTFGGNIGNLIYQYSVFRTLMTKDTIITPDYYTYGPDRADEINENYDCYIIPLADAFRNEFIPSLRRYTKLINKLKIPVVVIGVGLRAPFEPKLNEGFPFDKDVKNFVKAVLKKSSIIGVRGEITAKYLTRLGFREGIDHVVIGCPSMYTFGRELSIRNTRVTKESKICVNSSRRSQKKVLEFIARGMAEYPNHYFIPQWLKELKLTYLGAPSIAEISKKYPIKMSDPVYMNNRVRFFLNVPTWLEFMKDADLSFGARLHGNIAATIAGTPSLIIPKDARMRELAEYHQLTNLMANKITGKTSLLEIIEKSDFQSPVKVQGRNFDHFIDFLNKNQLEHIYINTVTPSTVPLDQKLVDIQLQPPVKPVSGCSLEEMVERWERYYPLESSQKNGSKVLITKENLVAMVMERIFKKKEQVFKRLSKVGSK
ncbi:polysaccharide pyruvyl transferase family protein [Niallia circulans]|uniref:polysaccharide pyruvyl transferase family protein n=1 Tax=Niallia circulans TaxID=1397 RepID=UPI00203D4417|nr:polysaccharide pyruvyl transferase family protein [Niallia circulans]MCM2981877.1 polysaccharide pyruvyl transferase family protein [Niallia circulans]